MSESITLWAIGTVIPIAIAVAVKYIKRKKLADKAYAAGRNIGTIISKFLVLRIGEKAAEKFEEGIIVSAVDIASSFFAGIGEGALADNKKKAGSKKDGGKNEK